MSSVVQDLALALDPVQLARRMAIEPEAWQVTVLRSLASQILLCCARQTGKTMIVALLTLHLALYRPGSLTLVVSHRQEGANEFLAKVRVWARRLAPVESDSTTELKLANGSRMVALPATAGSTRGYSAASMLVLDEAAFIENDTDVVGAVLPTLSGDGRLVVLSTPNGKRGWFWGQWDSGADWERHRVTVAESAQWTPKRIAAQEAILGPFKAASELWCKFEGSGSSVFPQEDIDGAYRAELETVF